MDQEKGSFAIITIEKMGRVINLTPHSIVLRSYDGEDTTLPPSPLGPARISSRRGSMFCSRCGVSVEHHSPDEMGQSGLCGDMSPEWGPFGVELRRAPQWGAIEGLPEPEEGTIYIVSALVAQRAIGRADVFCPGTGPLDGCVRDEHGHVVAVTSLVQAPLAESTADGRCPKGNIDCGC
jgi:hypothetical protein